MRRSPVGARVYGSLQIYEGGERCPRKIGKNFFLKIVQKTVILFLCRIPFLTHGLNPHCYKREHL